MPRKKIENDINEEIKDVKPKRIRKTSTEKKSEEKTPITEEKTTKRKRTTKTKKKETNSVTTNRNEKIITAGDRECYCYVSVKLSSMKKDANIISLAMISPDGDTLYVENKEINIDFIDEKYKNTTIHCTKDHKPHLTGHTWVMSGTLEEIKAAILLWLDENYSNKGKFVQFVFDKNIYEFAIFKELLTEGKTFDEVKLSYSETCLDLNFNIASLFTVDMNETSISNFVPINEAYNISRSDIYEIKKLKVYVTNLTEVTLNYSSS